MVGLPVLCGTAWGWVGCDGGGLVGFERLKALVLTKTDEVTCLQGP
jgi:hypothetical protein